MPRQERERNATRREAYDDDDDDDPYKIYYTLGRNNEEAIKRQEENIKQIKKGQLDNFKVFKCAFIFLGCLQTAILILLLVNTFQFHTSAAPASVAPARQNTTDADVGCDAGWVDTEAAGLGCVRFKGTAVSYSEANEYCQHRGAHLIEILTPIQLDWLRNQLKDIDAIDHYWFGGATDQKKEGKWIWTHSNIPVNSFVWRTGEPSGDNSVNHLCFHKDNDYFAGDYTNESHCSIICQK